MIILTNRSLGCKRQIAMLTRGLLILWQLLTEFQPVKKICTSESYAKMFFSAVHSDSNMSAAAEPT